MGKKALTIDGYAGLYEITKDGQVFSLRKHRFMKPAFNSMGYIMYYLTPHKESGLKQRWFMSHRLVMFTYGPPPPSRWHTDCHHKDHNKTNNHISNLEWLTHSENLLKSWRETDRVSPLKGIKRGPHSPETIARMSLAKEKGVYVEQGDGRREYKSVQVLLDDLGIYRKAFNRSIKSGKPYKGMEFGFL